MLICDKNCKCLAFSNIIFGFMSKLKKWIIWKSHVSTLSFTVFTRSFSFRLKKLSRLRKMISLKYQQIDISDLWARWNYEQLFLPKTVITYIKKHSYLIKKLIHSSFHLDRLYFKSFSCIMCQHKHWYLYYFTDNWLFYKFIVIVISADLRKPSKLYKIIHHV